ncbi:MAG: DNA translocase FtsK [Candidatus Gracilibacteria bacterium]|nr:DNA translocase FtsK [Candidatus Gracilibacteria bacterium]
MAARKSNILNYDAKRYIYVSLFMFIGIVAFLDEKSSVLGYFLSMGLTEVFGEYYKWIFSPVLLLFSLLMIKDKSVNVNATRIIGLFIYFISLSTLIGFFIKNYYAVFNLYPLLEDLLGSIATALAFFLLFLTSLVILFRFSPVNFARKAFDIPEKLKEIKDTFVGEGFNSKEEKKTTKNKNDERLEKKKQELEVMMEKLKEEKEALAKAKQPKQLNIEDAPTNPKKIIIEKKEAGVIGGLFGKKEEEKNEHEVKIVRNEEFKNWVFPELSLLDSKRNIVTVDKNEIRKKEIEIEEKLLQFKIEVTMEGYRVGPTVIQYRLKPKQGVKLQKIENLKKDLALALQAKSIRIQAPIPGLGVVGIEVPNPKREAVYLKEVLSSTEFNNKKLELPIAIGKDVSGNIVVGDLVKMPHLLVAGQTASGKSVGMNGFIISMLYKFSPSELKMILIDPKRVELSVYNGIPHLLTPVITNPDKALNALKWCVAEMLRRYDLATKVNARNLVEFNAKVKKEEKLPYIIIVVDELADLMMSGNKKEVEGSIARIAQMARAVGMHLIVATQRPSVDVITGLIKANIPSRIAFTVASQIDSRTVIDKAGAEDLLGRGDMLYAPTGSIDAERVQGVLVETHEVEAVVNKLKLTIDPDMISNLQIAEITEGKSKLEGSIMENYKGDQDEDPAIIEKAIQIVKESKKGSTSLIQRKLGLGYARAAKVLDILEELGVVGPSNGSKPREVYVD